jgi:two-component system chemotaxis response regulator CheY
MANTILVVDDSASIRQMIAYTFQAEGYTVVEAADGEEGLAKAHARDDIDLILSDQNMPNMDGLTLVNTLRDHPRYVSTPILMLTTESNESMKMQGRAAGANGWLVKPFNPEKLLAVVKKFLAN